MRVTLRVMEDEGGVARAARALASSTMIWKAIDGRMASAR